LIVSHIAPWSSTMWKRGAPMVLRCRCCVDMLVRRGSVLVGADQCVPVPPSLDHGWSAPRRIMSHCPPWSVLWIFAARVRVGDGGAPFDLGSCPARVARRQRLPGEGRWQRSGGRASDFRTAAPPDPPGVGDDPDPGISGPGRGHFAWRPTGSRRLRGRLIDATRRSVPPHEPDRGRCGAAGPAPASGPRPARVPANQPPQQPSLTVTYAGRAAVGGALICR
jgi:hypothetical protein